MRMQFEFVEELIGEMETLQKEIGATSKKELFNNAYVLLAWATRQIKSGKIIAALDEGDGSYSELLMPIFESIKAKRTPPAAAQQDDRVAA